MIVSVLRNGFTFCQGEIGKEDFSGYIEYVVKPIDFVYCSTPNPSTMNLWFKDIALPESYNSMIMAICDIIKMSDATEYHIEGDENIDVLRKYCTEMDFPYFLERDITYSAPIDQMRLVKKRKPYTLLSFSKNPIRKFTFQYSHQFLEGELSARSPLTCFDPLIGKGLLSRYCVQYGHMCHGIEMNPDRLKTAIGYVKSYENQTNLSSLR